MVEDAHPPLPEEDASNNLKEFLLFLFVKEPSKRPTAKACLEHPWVRNAEKLAGKRGSWKDTLKKVERYNTKKKHATMNGLKALSSIDWAQVNKDQVSDPSPGSSGEVFRDLDKSNSLPKSELDKNKLLKMGHRNAETLGESTAELKRDISSQVALSPEIMKSNHELQYIVLWMGIETRRNFLFSYNVYKMKVCVTYPKPLANVYIIERSYSDFQSLESKVRMLLKDAEELATLPELPKLRFWGAMEEQYVTLISTKISEYLSKLLEIKLVYASRLMQLFLREDSVSISNSPNNSQHNSLSETSAKP